jgi:Transposase DDE domain/Domain of unknown function (DUF4372)
LVFLSYHTKKYAMSKGTFFTGQPIFNQVLNFVPPSMIVSIVRELRADYYCKRFKTYEHLVTMLYAIFNQCTSIREVTTGLLAWDQRIHHLGMQWHPRRSTLADANERRKPEVFEKIYYKLLQRYQKFLPDSPKGSGKKNLYIFDSTSISLFKEILQGSGHKKSDGKHKGGIKVHTLLKSDQDVPHMVRYSAAVANDSQFLKQVQLPAGSVIVFDRGYYDYCTYNRFDSENITWVTRYRNRSVYRVLQACKLAGEQKQQGIKADRRIELGHEHRQKTTKVKARMIEYKDPVSKKKFQFLTNNMELPALTIAKYYQRRWQIETFFKRIKQNYPLRYFLGDNENAIKIQIWCVLIADLLLKVIKQGTRSRMSYSNMKSLIRLHLMTYMNLIDFLKSPEKALVRKIQLQRKYFSNPSLFGP